MATNGPFIGYVGFVRFNGDAGNKFAIRSTSCDINLSQEITTEDVIDSRWDRTVYRVGPKIVEGSIAFPGIYTITGSGAVESTDIMQRLYTRAVRRRHAGNWEFILHSAPIDVKYTIGDQFTYTKCLLDSWQFTATQQEPVNMNISIIGSDRIPLDGDTFLDGPTNPSTDAWSGNLAAQTRVITWNDAFFVARLDTDGDGIPEDSLAVCSQPLSNIGNCSAINGINACSDIASYRIRSYEININNNADRFYTIGQLSPAYIYPSKREVSGNVVILGRHEGIGGTDTASGSQANELFCRSGSDITFGYQIAANAESDQSCGGDFCVTLPNVIFMIEEMALTNDIFETTVNWISLPAGGQIDNINAGADAYYDPLDIFTDLSDGDL